ncbi:MAG: hypothetical protein QW303_01430 [Nitrososphaerota archaeon]
MDAEIPTNPKDHEQSPDVPDIDTGETLFTDRMLQKEWGLRIGNNSITVIGNGEDMFRAAYHHPINPILSVHHAQILECALDYMYAISPPHAEVIDFFRRIGREQQQ